MNKKLLRRPLVFQFSIAEHVEYSRLTLQTCQKFKSIINEPELQQSYQTKVLQEESVYKWKRKSEFTKKKLDVDHQRDLTYTGMKGIVQANLRNFDPAVRDSAFHIANLLDNYGNFSKKGYDAETAAIDSIIEHLGKPDYTPSVTALALLPWITELTSLNNLFKTYVDDTTQEQVDKPDVSFREARNQTDLALHELMDRITAKINLEGPDTYLPFIKEFNVTTDHYNTLMHEHYGRLHVRTDIGSAKIGDIATMSYTGKPIYVIPSVSIDICDKDGDTKQVDLIFSVDFTVAYQNNIEPGTAGLTISGIGKYTGSIQTTFNIVIDK